MPWRWMSLRGSKVLARCDASGKLVQNGGRVEIRYKPNDGRSYRAAATNLEEHADGAEVFPDGYCGDAEAPKPKANTGSSSVPTSPAGNEVLVYADGACSGNPGPAGLGVVMRWDNHRKELSEYLGDATNNIAELTAILRALEATPDRVRSLRIYTDSKYSIGVLTQGWKAKANRELIAEIRERLSNLDDVQFFHVRGHAGVELNERADELAVQAVESRASAGWRDVT